MAPPFVIFALPRSRTAWLSRFLTHSGSLCAHDESRHFRDLSDIRAWLSQDDTGSAETGSAPWWRLALKIRPDIRIVTVRRSVNDVVNSLMVVSPELDRGHITNGMKRLDAKLDQVEHRIPGVLSVKYEDLNREETCGAVFHHCLGRPMTYNWWAVLDGVNVQCSMPGMIRYASSHKGQLEKITALATSFIRTDLFSRKRTDHGPITIQRESFDTFLQDGEALFTEHSADVGEHPRSFTRKNLPVMRYMDQNGCLQVTTARSNGRMFGYIMIVISPSLEALDLTCAIPTTIYASKDYPGLGIKLMRSALQSLRERGDIDEVFYRAGVRGSGPRMGAFYLRQGALPDGEIYRQTLRSN